MMKIALLTGVILFYNTINYAQNTTQRRIDFKTFRGDSVNFPLNDDYYLIEDSCAQIVRCGHFDFQKKTFFGPFKDISKQDHSLILSEGTYTADGLKTGLFTAHFLNGKLEARGNFQLNNLDGRWEIYYEDGKPKLNFTASNGDITINDAWNAAGAKIIDNGTGPYLVNQGSLSWKGKLVNGKPDGTWKLISNDYVTAAPMVTENFKKNEFKKGATQYAEYTDKTHIVLLDADLLPFLHAEKMLISSVPCNGAKPKHKVGAQYKDGFNTFNEYIKDQVAAYFKDINYKEFNGQFTIAGDVSEKGDIGHLKSNDDFRQDISHGLIMKFRSLPLLMPATIDGKPVTQKFSITFVFSNGFYSFHYQLLPL